MASVNASGASSFMIQSATRPVYWGMAISPEVRSFALSQYWSLSREKLSLAAVRSTYRAWWSPDASQSFTRPPQTVRFTKLCLLYWVKAERTQQKLQEVSLTIRRDSDKQQHNNKAPIIGQQVCQQPLHRNTGVLFGLLRRPPLQHRRHVLTPEEPRHDCHGITLQHLQNKWYECRKMLD